MKTYIGVTAYTNPEGVTTPLSITWTDGSVFEIDKVLSVRPLPMRTEYEVSISGQVRVINYAESRWFVVGS